jgi:hypothetical protein
MPTFTYVGETARDYPYPPIMRVLTHGDQVDFESEQDVPDDGRFEPAAAPPAQSAAQPPSGPATKSAVKKAKATTAAKAPDPVEE